MSLHFSGKLWHWRGPAPHYFVRVPPSEAEELRAAARLVTYGWGMIPVTLTLGQWQYDTSLFPKDGGYLVPIRADVRTAEGWREDDEVTVTLSIRAGQAARATRRISLDGED